MESFYGFTLLEVLEVIPTLRSLEAWRARTSDREITLVRSRPDIITDHLSGDRYGSNLKSVAADLRAIAARRPQHGELRLLEICWMEKKQVPLGVFEPYLGCPLRDMVMRITCPPPIAAAVVLEILHSYDSDTAATAVTPHGKLIRQVLPRFPEVWDSESPSFLGDEPEISIIGRLREARASFARMTSIELDEGTLVAELERIADRAAAGPALARLLAASSFDRAR